MASEFGQLVKSFAFAVNAAEVAALQRVEALMKKRIHELGEKEDGSLIGGYAEGAWREKRIEKGRQVDYVDLEFNSDLRKGYTTGRAEDKNALGFPEDKQFVKADAHNEEYGKTFAASESEIDEGMKQYELVLDKHLPNEI